MFYRFIFDVPYLIKRARELAEWGVPERVAYANLSKYIAPDFPELELRRMDYRKLLGDILNAIPQSITPTNKKGTNAEICYKIQLTAVSISHPF